MHRAFMFLMFVIALLALTRRSWADEVSIYDSPSDPKKVVVVYCTDAGKCNRLITTKLTLEADYATIEKWLSQVTKEPLNER